MQITGLRISDAEYAICVKSSMEVSEQASLSGIILFEIITNYPRDLESLTIPV